MTSNNDAKTCLKLSILENDFDIGMLLCIMSSILKISRNFQGSKKNRRLLQLQEHFEMYHLMDSKYDKKLLSNHLMVAIVVYDNC
ncbi:hypothetical protein T07_10228 [Trichinella nelsoni]|uniref:Uncharacterized protein n=1 Tax=Trichinella nelsoni TaxID=6336 RepID=A0A0V0RLP5_9BILA|nr:hypothetical protein T07_10228 [Trichinella nelsoni]